MAGIRLNTNHYLGAIKPVSFTLFPASGNSYAAFRIVYNPTITGATWAAASEGIADVLSNAGTPTISGGSVLYSGFLSTSNKNQTTFVFAQELLTDVALGHDLNGNADALVMEVTSSSGNFDLLFSGQYQEFR